MAGTFGMTSDEYKNYIAGNGPDIFKLLDGKVSFLGRGDELWSASFYSYPLILIPSPGAHYKNLSKDYGYTYQGGHVALYAPERVGDGGKFIVYSEQGTRSITCTESDVLRILNSVI